MYRRLYPPPPPTHTRTFPLGAYVINGRPHRHFIKSTGVKGVINIGLRKNSTDRTGHFLIFFTMSSKLNYKIDMKITENWDREHDFLKSTCDIRTFCSPPPPPHSAYLDLQVFYVKIPPFSMDKTCLTPAPPPRPSFFTMSSKLNMDWTSRSQVVFLKIHLRSL